MRKNEYVNLPVICLVGPTASGKSGLAVRVCRRLYVDEHPAEIINTDSMVVYRGMDIGTATPTLREQRTVVHHLVSILDGTQPRKYPTDQLTYLARVSAIGVHPDQIGHRRSRSGHR